MAFKSSSVAFWDAGHGIGGLIGRDTPMCLPVRIVPWNSGSDLGEDKSKMVTGHGGEVIVAPAMNTGDRFTAAAANGILCSKLKVRPLLSTECSP